MRLLLHIGPGKTGTSTLQRTLRREWSTLAEVGVLYPPVRGTDSHPDIICSFLPPERLPRGFGELRARATVRDRGDAFWTDVEHQIDRFRPHVVIMSCEHLFGCTTDELAVLRGILDERFTDIDIIAYVRHPASHYLSLVQQKVRAAHGITPPGQYRARGKTELSRYQEVFERVSVRAFDRARLRDGCIARDFLRTYVPAGDDLADRITVVNVNESISAEAMCIMQSLRRHGWPDEDDEFAPESDRVLQALRTIEGEVPHVAPELKPWLRAAFSAKHKDELDWLEEHFGITFPGSANGGAMPDPMPDGWMSQDLTKILEVDKAAIDFMLYMVLKQVARRPTRRERIRSMASVPGRWVTRSLARRS